MSQYIQGTVKGVKFEDGNTRILLERKDGTQFVAISEGIELDPAIGSTFREPHFSKAGSLKGMDLYTSAKFSIEGGDTKDPERPLVLRVDPKDIPKCSMQEIDPPALEFDVALQVEIAALNAAVVAHSTTGLSIDELYRIYADKLIANACIREQNAQRIIKTLEEQTQ